MFIQRYQDETASVRRLILKYKSYNGATIHTAGDCMEEELCIIEILKDNNDFIARIKSDLGGNREYKSQYFEDVLEQFVMDLQEEFESM